MEDEAQIAIITGRGRAFSSGADVKQRQLRSREEFLRLGGPQGRGTHSADLLTRSVNWKPVIAAPHGYVLGLSVGIVLECDLIVAEEGTRFQITETSRGSRRGPLLGHHAVPGRRRLRDGGGPCRSLLHRRGGACREPDQSCRAPRGRYLDMARELARDVVKNPPLSVRSTVRTRRWYHGPHDARDHAPDRTRAALSL